jgi:hypothetical protein
MWNLNESGSTGEDERSAVESYSILVCAAECEWIDLLALGVPGAAIVTMLVCFLFLTFFLSRVVCLSF